MVAMSLASVRIVLRMISVTLAIRRFDVKYSIIIGVELAFILIELVREWLCDYESEQVL